MLILNFSHPLTELQLTQIEAIAGQPISEIRNIPTQFDNDKPYQPQVQALVANMALDTRTWQSASILVNPPAYNFGALTLLAELHGRMGYFPAILRLRPRPKNTPTCYEIAEIINLQAVRDSARQSRDP